MSVAATSPVTSKARRSDDNDQADGHPANRAPTDRRGDRRRRDPQRDRPRRPLAGRKDPPGSDRRAARNQPHPLARSTETLASEGIVTYHPQRGYFVTELPAGAIADIYVVRDLLETQTEEITIPHLTDDDLRAMQTHLRDQARAVENRDAVEMIAANRRFHFVIFNRCENGWLTRFVIQLWDTLDPYRVLSYQRMWLEDPERHVPAEILDEHKRILVALEKRNTKQALRLLEQHRARSETFLRVLIDRRNNPKEIPNVFTDAR